MRAAHWQLSPKVRRFLMSHPEALAAIRKMARSGSAQESFVSADGAAYQVERALSLHQDLHPNGEAPRAQQTDTQQTDAQQIAAAEGANVRE